MNFDSFFQNVLTDTEVKVMELLHENIRRQAFFGTPWPAAKNPAKAGKKLLYQSGDMQDGYMSRTEEMSIIITNSVDYAGVHNEGADIPVTAQIKKFSLSPQRLLQGKLRSLLPAASSAREVWIPFPAVSPARDAAISN